MWWVSSVQEARRDIDLGMRVYRLDRVTYGDQPASVLLELALRLIISPHCKTALGKVLLGSDRYVDDVFMSELKQQELMEAIDDVKETMQYFGFDIKRIITNQLWYHPAKGLLLEDGTDKEGLFSPDEQS